MEIGKTKETQSVILDLEKLITTRLLVQANSGGGKSWLLRKILEESHGKVQQIILDLEGEFSTLREKYDYLLVGRDGEIPCNIKTAQLLSKKVLELNVSTIIDLSELKKHERIIFVKRFLDGLMDSPRKLWRPVLVVVDEAHQFCPQASKSDSASAVIDLMTRGRKRGFCGILATQRISKLHKDACAETNNKLIGRTGLDVDRKRASDELGFNSKENEISLRNLEAGEFFAFGPGISKEIVKFKVGQVKTTHPEAGKIILKPSETPENIKKLLKDIIDLPKEAETELRDLEDYKKKVINLKREIRILEKGKPEQKIDEDKLKRIIEKHENIGYNQGKLEDRGELDFLRTELKKIEIRDSKIRNLLEMKQSEKIVNTPKPLVRDGEGIKNLAERVGSPQSINNNYNLNPEVKIKSGAMRILGWLCGVYPESLSKQRLATVSGFSVNGGTFGAYISNLKKIGWISGGEDLTATEEGLENSTETRDIPKGEELIELWSSKFKSGIGRMLKSICARYPYEIDREELGEETGFTPSGGTFGAYISKLRKNSLIEVNGSMIKASSEFFE